MGTKLKGNKNLDREFLENHKNPNAKKTSKKKKTENQDFVFLTT